MKKSTFNTVDLSQRPGSFFRSLQTCKCSTYNIIIYINQEKCCEVNLSVTLTRLIFSSVSGTTITKVTRFISVVGTTRKCFSNVKYTEYRTAVAMLNIIWHVTQLEVENTFTI